MLLHVVTTSSDFPAQKTRFYHIFSEFGFIIKIERNG